MLYTVVDFNDVFGNMNSHSDYSNRSSNPYSYIRCGYFLDNASLYGGHNNVNYNFNYPKHITSNMLGIPNK